MEILQADIKIVYGLFNMYENYYHGFCDSFEKALIGQKEIQDSCEVWIHITVHELNIWEIE